MSPKSIVVKKMKDFFKKGELICKEGDHGEAMYIIQSGKVEVIKKTGDEEVVLATLEPKAFFGEMALFGDPRRSATIRAASDTKMVVINKAMLDSQFEKVPDWFVKILKTLVERLRETNQRIKSRFKISFEFSVLKALFLIARNRGNATGDQCTLELSVARREVPLLLGISQEEFMDKLKNLSFVGLMKYSDPKNQILIPDMKRVRNFLAFLRMKGEEEGGQAGDFGDDQTREYFEKIYKLLFRRKL